MGGVAEPCSALTRVARNHLPGKVMKICGWEEVSPTEFWRQVGQEEGGAEGKAWSSGGAGRGGQQAG